VETDSEVTDPEAEEEADEGVNEVLASLPVKAPSATLRLTTGAEFESEFTYHLCPNASGIDLISHPFDRPTGKAAMKASTSVSLISCSKELIPGDLGPVNQLVISAKTDS
jgi:hypothetical protein